MNKQYKNIVILTGAGISAEAGLATFRSSNGLWNNHRVEDVASVEGFQNVSAVEADGLVYLAVNVVNVFIVGFFVERVDILGNDGNFGRIFVLQAGNR